MVIQRWYSYVTNTQTPYDEVWIALQEYMPNSVKIWGCNKLKQNFANQLPPYGCGVDGKWL